MRSSPAFSIVPPPIQIGGEAQRSAHKAPLCQIIIGVQLLCLCITAA